MRKERRSGVSKESNRNQERFCAGNRKFKTTKYMTVRFTFRFTYTRVKEHPEPLEIDNYIVHRNRARSHIELTFGVLRSLHKTIGESITRSYEESKKTDQSERSEVKHFLPEHLACVLQEFVQKQHLDAKRYLRKLKQQGARERFVIFTQEQYRRLSDEEVTRKERARAQRAQSLAWGRSVTASIGWNGLYFTAPRPSATSSNSGTRKRFRNVYTGEWENEEEWGIDDVSNPKPAK